MSGRFNKAAADAAVAFIECLKHSKGRWANTPFKLLPWQKEIIRSLFGTMRPDGKRQYRTAFIEVPRKNGKSSLAAAVALKMLFADGEEGAEVYIGAEDREQAGVVFSLAAQMVRRDPDLSKACTIVDSQKRIVVPSTSSFMRAIPADAAGAHGFNASAVIADELHAWPNRDLWDVLATSTGAREQPLLLAITTAGFDRTSVAREQYDYAKRVLAKIIDDPSFFGCIFEAEEVENWQDEKVWHKANPALEQFRSIDEMRSLATKAREIPAQQNAFKRLYLNIWTQQETVWIPVETWDASAGWIDDDILASLKGRTCYAGLDLASTTDIAALCLCFPPTKEDGDFINLYRFWIPEVNMQDRMRRDGVPYDVWEREGLIKATEGNVIDYAVIRQDINDLWKLFPQWQEIAFDPWNATQLATELTGDGFEMIEIQQSYANLSAPMKEIERLVLQKRLRHGANPVMRWMVSNVQANQSANGDRKPDKKKSKGRIDGVLAQVMALGRATLYEPSVYETRPITVLG